MSTSFATAAEPSTAAAPAAAAKAPAKSVLNESRQIERAAMLIRMGARMQVLESETSLSYERLIRLYKEIAGKSPSKGQLPFSTDWFLTWQENIHSSLFLNIYEYLSKAADMDSIDLLTKAWRLVKFVDADMLTMTACSRCAGKFVTEPYENARHFLCGLCNPPARAGKSKASGALMVH